jgi:5-methylcytosine-specific restriction enzyme A
MTNYLANETLDEVIDLVNAATSLRFVRSTISEPGWDIEAIRLSASLFKDSTVAEPLFDIGILREPSYARIIVKPDQFAGGFVRLVRDAVTGNPSLWTDFLEERKSLGIEASIDIDDERFEFDGLPRKSWQSFLIDCKKRIPRSEKQNRANYMKDVIVLGLGMILITGALEMSDGVESEPGLREGSLTKVLVNKYERSYVNRLSCISHYGTDCWACGMNFKDSYGKAGEGFIQVHHVTPVSQIGEGYRVNPLTDLIPLCSNCHSIIHRKRDNPLSPSELREVLGKPVKAL